MTQRIGGGASGAPRWSLFFWFLTCCLGIWLGVLLGLLHQSRDLSLEDFLVSIFVNTPTTCTMALTALWVFSVCLLGSSKVGVLWLLGLTLGKSLLQGYVFSLLFYLHPVAGLGQWMGLYLGDCLFFGTGSFGLMITTMARLPKGVTLRNQGLFLLYFILCSCAKVWYLQTL